MAQHVLTENSDLKLKRHDYSKIITDVTNVNKSQTDQMPTCQIALLPNRQCVTKG